MMSQALLFLLSGIISSSVFTTHLLRELYLLPDLLGERSREEQQWERCWKETGDPPVASRAEGTLVTVHSSLPSSSHSSMGV